MTVSCQDAAERAQVRLPSGRMGTLIYAPLPDASSRQGRLAKVRLDTGAFLSCSPDLLEVLTGCEDLCMDRCQGPCGVLPL